MKKLGIAFIMALLALAFVAVPAFAYEPPQGAEADVTCDEPGVSDESPTVGDTIYFYGTIHYDISAYNNSDYDDGYSHYYHSWYQTGAYVILDASGHYLVVAPDGTTAAEDGFDWSSGYIMGDTGYWYCWPWDEDVSYDIDEPWNWEAAVVLEQAGEYTYQHDGDASAEYGHWVQLGHYEGHGYDMHFVPDGDPIFIPEGDPAYDKCFSEPKTVIALSNAPLATGRTRPILTILTSQDKDVYFPSEGWGDPTTDDIVYNDGTWQVEIADGTKILLDGEWHRKTWIEVDDQGNVIGRYGSSGHIVAEEIALSSPITITKVG